MGFRTRTLKDVCLTGGFTNVSAGDSVRILNHETYKDMDFSIDQVSVNTTFFKGNSSYSDYEASCYTMPNELPVVIKIRINHCCDSTAMVFDIHDKFSYDKDFYEQNLLSDNCELKVFKDCFGEKLRTPLQFWRINGSNTPYKSKVRYLNKSETKEVLFWDYHRNTVANEVMIKEYFTVEMDKETREFTMFRGSELDPSDVIVF